MKYDQKLNIVVKRPGQSLRRGFTAACLAGILCLPAGCGTERELLSELRQEEAFPESLPEEAEDGEGIAAAGTDEIRDKGQEADNGTDLSAVPENGGEAEGSIFVHVCGAVACPGVYELPEGSRFYEAVEAAGGFTEDACRDYLNMAAPLADGSRLEIPVLQKIREQEAAEKREKSSGGDEKEEYSYYTVPDEPASGAESAGTGGEGLVNINTADAEGLCSLPGVGESRAKAIIEYRETQGGFQKKEDIMQVSGIGEKMYARMEAFLTVE